ncbi:MAG: sodium-dependent transporter [Gammaproteobacteria bacterium]|nr:sodium-dependent transporter [Gammaproteobacteria bacterium]
MTMADNNRTSLHGLWTSRWAFIMAATGSAVGLGNIWKFPYMAGENGGGAFVLVYLLCIFLIGVPIMMAEVMLGRRGRRNPVDTMKHLAAEAGRSQLWKLLGWMGIAAGFLILSYYSVIAGWAISYIFTTGAGTFTGADAASVGQHFDELTKSPLTLIFWHSIFMLMTMAVVVRGIEGGIEKAVRFLIPALFVLMIVMVLYAMTTSGFAQGLHFMFTPDFSKISTEGVLAAMGQAFFTLSIGMGAIMVYGAYLPKEISIAQTSFTIAFADTLVAILAGLVIFPIVFANGLETGSGPGLIFVTLPLAFGNMAFGTLFGTLFFILLVFAAWSSSISLIEPAVAWLIENKGLSRLKASMALGLLTWVIGLGTVFSFNEWSNLTVFGKTFFGLLDYLTSNIMLPLGGVLMAIFAGWLMKKAASQGELALGASAYSIWYFLVRYVTPIAVMLVFLNAIGMFS